MSFRVYSLFSQTEAERKASFEGWKKGERGGTLLDYPQEHLVAMREEKVSLFVKFEIMIQHRLCFLFEPRTNKHYRTSNSMINFKIHPRTYQKQKILLSARQRSSNYIELSKGNVFGKYDAVTLTMLCLKFFRDMASQNS